MRIDRIGRHPQHIPALAAWHHAEWGALYDDWTLDAAASALADHATRTSLHGTPVVIMSIVPAERVAHTEPPPHRVDDA